MPILHTPTVRQRLADLLRAHPGVEFSMTEISKLLACDLSILPGHGRALASADPHVYFVEPAARGFGARVRYSPPAAGSSK